MRLAHKIRRPAHYRSLPSSRVSVGVGVTEQKERVRGSCATAGLGVEEGGF